MTVIYDKAAEVTAADRNAHQRSASDMEEDRRLRVGNGIRDEVAFTRLLALGVDEADLHRVAMGMVRLVQSGRDPHGDYAAILGIVRTGVNGTTAAQEVV